MADAGGIVRFTTIFPGWYRGRTTHIHCKVHVDRKTVRTTQLFFDDALTEEVYAAVSPYDEHTGRHTRNDTDSIYDPSGVVTAQKSRVGYVAALLRILELGAIAPRRALRASAEAGAQPRVGSLPHSGTASRVDLGRRGGVIASDIHAATLRTVMQMRRLLL